MRTNLENLPIARIWTEQKRIDLAPPYQREAGIWSLEKKQLLVDSIFNDFDLPKFYFHHFAPHNPILYAVIDGKQRVSAILEYLNDGFPLRDDFKYTGEYLSEGKAPEKGLYFSALGESWREWFKSRSLAVVMVETDDLTEIEDMFSRLNSGERLNSAESRNAFGGRMSALIREVATHDFFTKKVSFKNNRYQHYEVACRFLYIDSQFERGILVPDLKKKALDDFVKSNSQLSEGEARKILGEVTKKLKAMCKIFEDNATELSKQTYPQVYYMFLRDLQREYAHVKLNAYLQDFFPKFEAYRFAQMAIPEEQRMDWDLLGRYALEAQQGTSNAAGMAYRIEILTAFFLKWFPDVESKDPKRSFTDAQRLAIYLRAEKRCQECTIKLNSLGEMHADHIKPHSLGGKSNLENAQCLCIDCNLKKSNKLSLE